MSGFGLSETGFGLKSLAQIKTEIEAALRAEFGTSINLLPESVFGQIIAIVSNREASVWEVVQAVYASMDPNQAEGLSLNRVAAITGLARLPATATTVEAVLTGTAGTVIPSGSRARVANTDILFQLTEDATVEGGGTVTVTFTCTETGAVPCLSGTLTVIDTPVSGWDAVLNTVDGDVGRDEESDADFRLRRLQSLSVGAAGTVDAIRATVLQNVTGILAALVIENDTDSTDGDGRPPHSLELIVHGNDLDDDEVAGELWSLKPAGIATHGSTTVSVEDSQGYSHDVSFSHAAESRVYLRIVLRVGSGFDAGAAMVVPVTINTAVAYADYTITLNGVDITYTAAGGDGVADIAAGLVDLINGSDGLWRNVSAVDDGSGDFHVVSSEPGNAFALSTEDDAITIGDPTTADSGDQIAVRAAVLALFNSEQGVGDDVYLSRFYEAIHDVANVLSATITATTSLATPVTWSASDITVDSDEIAALESYDIVVELA